MSLTDIAAAVISEARHMSGLTNAEFDHDTKVRGVGGPHGPLGNACYTIATRDLPDTVTTDEREAIWLRLWADLQPEMRAYEQRCRDREYSGWSNASCGPIRYAS